MINGDVPLTDNGNYELFCSFADLLKNEEEDAAMDLQLANQGYMAKFRWLVLHRGYTEEEAKKMVQEAVEERNANETEESRLFGEE